LSSDTEWKAGRRRIRPDRIRSVCPRYPEAQTQGQAPLEEDVQPPDEDPADRRRDG